MATPITQDQQQAMTPQQAMQMNAGAVGQPGDANAALGYGTPVDGGSHPVAQLTAQQQAQQQAAAETAGAVSPLNAQIATLQSQQKAQIGAVNGEFANLLPYANQQAQQTQLFNRGAAQDSAAIFAQAGQALNVLQQNQASEAQRLAQQTGGPVSTGAFTAATDPYETAMMASGATSQLTNLALGVAGTDEARQFAGQVLPAMKTEQEASIRSTINANIAGIRNQIASIKGNQSRLANAKLPALLAAQRNWELQKQNLALKRHSLSQQWEITQHQLKQRDRTLAIQESQVKHSWEATVRALDQKDRSLSDAEAAQAFSESSTTTRLSQSQQSINAQIAHLTVQEKQAAQSLNISQEEYVLRKDQYAASNKIANKRIAVQAESNTRQIITAFLGGSSSNRPVQVTTKKYLDPNDPQVKAATRYVPGLGGGKPPSNIYYDSKTNRWYTYIKTTQTPSQFAASQGTSGSPISDPNALYNAVKEAQGSQFKPKMVRDLIRSRLNLPHWTPGKSATGASTLPYDPSKPISIGNLPNATPGELHVMPLGKLTDIAIAYGYKPSPVAATRQALIDFIRHATST